MLKKILLGLLGLVVLFLVVAALQPAEYRVVRSTTIAAPPEQVFPHVNDFHKWATWSPWAKLDPAMQVTFTGPIQGGPGSVYGWKGNSKVGEGRMTLTGGRPNQQVDIRLEFVKPFPDACTTAFTFQPEGGGTTVTWTMTGRKNYLAKAMCLVVSMDRMVGGDFERGLARLKMVAEGNRN